MFLVQCHPNVRETLVCLKAAKTNSRFSANWRSSGASWAAAWPSAPVREAKLDILPVFYFGNKIKQHSVNGLLQNILDYCVFRGHLDDTVQAAWRRATLLIPPALEDLWPRAAAG